MIFSVTSVFSVVQMLKILLMMSGYSVSLAFATKDTKSDRKARNAVFVRQRPR
jgi:hypothetical protein